MGNHIWLTLSRGIQETIRGKQPQEAGPVNDGAVTNPTSTVTSAISIGQEGTEIQVALKHQQ